jgi:hypothetical protein
MPPRQAYDLVAGGRGLVLSRYVSPGEAADSLPTLALISEEGRSLKGGVSRRVKPKHQSVACK